jgi:OmpA-OmpF porin, OOP family
VARHAAEFALASEDQMNGRKLAAIPILLLGSVLLAGGADAQVKDKLTEQGNKARIVVGTIKSTARKCDGHMAASIGEMLSTALSQNPKFIVLANRDEVAELQDEIELGKSGAVESGRGADAGLMEGADIMVTGSVTAFEPEAGGGGGLMGAARARVAGQIGVGAKTAEIAIDLKLIDIRTRRVIKAVSLEAKSTSWHTGGGASSWVGNTAMSGALGVFSNKPMEKAVRAVLTKCVDTVSSEVPDEYYRYQGNGQYTQKYGAGKRAPAAGGDQGEGGATKSGSGDEGGSSAASAPAAEDMSLFTKYDFVPGDRVIFYDDLSREEAGEFPSRWGLEKGVFEVARLGQTNWILCSNNGAILPKIAAGPLPKKFTFEVDIYDDGQKNTGNHYTIRIMQAGRAVVRYGIYDAYVTFVDGPNGRLADKMLDTRLKGGPHTMRIMATATTLKCYLDNIRIANVPSIEGFAPDGIEIQCDPDGAKGNNMLLGNVRFAAGGKTLREQLDADGRIVTHGILFAPGSAVIQAESYKTLALIGDLLTGDAELKLSIEGHTDSDGTTESNQALSEKRAAAVKDYLVANASVDAARLKARGWGESKPVDKNETPEGKANNRRVELVKL